MAVGSYTFSGPIPRPPRHSLLDTARIVTDNDVHWANGGPLYSYSPSLPSVHDACLSGTFGLKVAGESPANPSVGAFTVYLNATCTSRGISEEEFVARAVQVFEARESFAVEREFLTADVITSNASLQGSATIVGGGAVSPKYGLALLEDEIGKTAQQGMLHAPPSIASLWSEAVYIEGQRLLTTATETPVAVGDGYIDVSRAGAGATGDNAYAWATGPIEIRRTDAKVVPDNISEALDRENNVVNFYVERDYLVSWDAELSVGVLINRAA